jgi:RNA-dependent RNA polymerase
MEKIHKPKEQIYVSHKVLGKLYDQVERIDFVPCFENPFDKRILEAYKLDDQLLEDAAAVKEQYDAAMRRIMAQHDIATEFEVWSTFVLHHANQSKDYKFHEEMGEISSALKDRFRQACYEVWE